MITKSSFSLKKCNSFAIEAICPKMFCPSSYEELKTLPLNTEQPFYILGEGSNTLFCENTSPILIKPMFKGISIEDCQEYYTVTVGAGENWHLLVECLVNQGINGLENLALIPGSVGAAPVQNIGAYGVELSDYCENVSWYEFQSKSLKELSANQCLFSYRDSIFKRQLKGKGLITEVTFRFDKKWLPNLTYAGLDSISENTSAKEIMERVIEIRQKKLPNPDEIPNAGSFFKNPVVTLDKLQQLKAIYPDIPNYKQADNSVKLAAGWLIDQCGMKGYRTESVGIHKQQALVVINHNKGSGKDVLDLALLVQKKVMNTFGITLEPEVRFVSDQGEVPFNKIGF